MHLRERHQVWIDDVPGPDGDKGVKRWVLIDGVLRFACIRALKALPVYVKESCIVALCSQDSFSSGEKLLIYIKNEAIQVAQPADSAAGFLLFL